MITWRTRSARLEESTDGRYTVTTRDIHGEPWHQARYRPPDDMVELLASCREREDAKGVCERHAEKAIAGSVS